jgi:hypothetical protein
VRQVVGFSSSGWVSCGGGGKGAVEDGFGMLVVIDGVVVDDSSGTFVPETLAPWAC